jgi:heme A synthase
VTEYQAKPKDVFVLPRTGGRGGRPPAPPQPGIAGWLKRNRYKLVLALIVAELIVAWQFNLSAVPLLLVAVVVLGLFLMYRSRLTNPAARNAAWILVLSQAAVAIVPLFVAVTLFAIVIVVLVVAVIMVMLLLGERSRR